MIIAVGIRDDFTPRQFGMNRDIGMGSYYAVYYYWYPTIFANSFSTIQLGTSQV